MSRFQSSRRRVTVLGARGLAAVFGVLGALILFPAMNARANTNTMSIQRATFGGGCFWCVEAIFQRLEGVKSVVSGYAGGTTPDPTYRQVCSGLTGHAEVVQVEFDAGKISFEKLLEVFWQAHDPTTLNRQGADIGTQYRSVILYHDEAQKAGAEKSKLAAQKQFREPIVTEIVPFTKFYRAEDYHQRYYESNRGAPYCSVVIRPKLEKLMKSGVIPEKQERNNLSKP